MPYSDVAVIIPSRIASTRLHAKPLAIIGDDMSMIEHVYHGVKMLDIHSTYVATDSEEVRDIVERRGGKCIMTSTSCPSGTDRVFEALCKLEEVERIKYIINVQGDMPFIDTKSILNIITKLKNADADIVTAVTKIDENDASNIANVKVVIDSSDRALYFSRSMIPHGASQYWYHVGIYGFKVDSLRSFVSLEASYLEKIERLEQLRALENGMNINVCYLDTIPISVDTEEDLQKARNHFAELKKLNVTELSDRV